MSFATASPSSSRSDSPELSHAPRNHWTPTEDSRLRAAVTELGATRGKEGAWKEIARRVGGERSNKDCRKRWFHSLDPAVRKGRWSTEEDQLLRDLHAELGPKWKEIALRIPGRKDDQCSKRWRDTLDPSLRNQDRWTSSEDAILLAGFDQVGARWTAIAEKLPGRSPLHCRNRMRKYSPANAGAGAGAGEIEDSSRSRTSMAGPRRTRQAKSSSSSWLSPPPPPPSAEQRVSLGEATPGLSPFDVNTFYPSFASLPSLQTSNAAPSPAPFTSAEIDLLLKSVPTDTNTDSLDWNDLPTFSPSSALPTLPLPLPPVLGRAQLGSSQAPGFAICCTCHGSGIVPLQGGATSAGGEGSSALELAMGLAGGVSLS
ncbi:Homeodomain-like protein [Leucosporidium creatinivorum]|uniref:Homeodomain-like protein n=1 Tax=Leucosporidium creatinivorum TaxID=106004 RepID=A0A1Y2FBP1_9BASI|nr:Homeodomain-like protein [Leucosporidium creatinivorum]